MTIFLRIIIFSLINGLAFSVHRKTHYEKEHAENYFKDFMKTFNKNYDEHEIIVRLKIFTANLEIYNERNKADTAVHGINQFSDLSQEEFSKHYTGLTGPPDFSSCKSVYDFNVVNRSAPATWDWRDRNAVTPIKSQSTCGSCFAFSTAANIESQYAIKKNVQLDLSEQQILDCGNNKGCKGGQMTESMRHIIKCGGIEQESDYPYENAKGECRENESLFKVKLSDCSNYQIKDEETLKQVLYENGPISIGVAGYSLHSYNGGVFKNCPGDVDHAVLLVGYGADPQDGDYWVIKNSWGTLWGEQGYGRIARGYNTCTLLNNYMASAIIA